MSNSKKRKCNIGEIFLYQSVIAVAIFGYGKWRSRHPKFKDPFMRKLSSKSDDIDGWTLLHVANFFIMGQIFGPQCILPVLATGIAWEGFESVLGKKRPSWLGGFGDITDNVNAKENENWWFGRKSDLTANLIGFILGCLFYK
ncbi:MAG: hypothetical protein DRM99_05125 [Thermoplasmata archaeon]|nr:MAG: hypothetical protein DRM99_05125 [Thermoplasmata archaeon]